MGFNGEKKFKKNPYKAEFLNTDKSRKAGGAKQTKSKIQQAMEQLETVLSNPNYSDEKQNEIVVDMFKANPDLKAAFLSKYQKMRDLSLDAPWKEIWNHKFDQLINSHNSVKPNKPEVKPEMPNLTIENPEKFELSQSTKIQEKKLKKKAASKAGLAENAKKTEEAKKAENEKNARNSHNSDNPNKPEVESEIPNLTKTQRKKLKKKAEKAQKAQKALEAVNAEKVVEAEKGKQGETAQPLQQNELMLNVEHHFMDNGKLVKKVSSSLD